ncbi:hypothetical protein ACVSQB_00340 [Bradyrhizobium elkanii]
MSDDVSIARTLAGIYGNNDTDFEIRICNGASAMDAPKTLKTAGPNALGKIADKLAQTAADNLR